MGGSAVTEEVFPGFKFSVCSYVVSLLRPQIVRELDLRRHGLEVLPLDGTFTPMPDGNYLWRTDDHDRTRQELERHSRRDAAVYDDYGRALVDMARFVKPTLDERPPDPVLAPPAGPRRPGAARPPVPGAPRRRPRALHPVDDDERRRVPRSVVRDRRAQGHDERLGDHRHVPRRPVPGHRVRAAPPLHGRDRRRVPVVGTRPGRHRRHLERHRRRGPGSGRRDPHERRGRPHPHRDAAAPRASSSTTATRSRPRSCPRRSIRG